MRIQWSSAAAQEMQTRIEEAKQGLMECLRQADSIRILMDEANVDGTDRALIKAEEQFERGAYRLKSFGYELDDFKSALSKADELFDATETMLFCRASEQVSAEPCRIISSGYVRWESTAYAVMPIMRIRTVLLPKWLEETGLSNV